MPIMGSSSEEFDDFISVLSRTLKLDYYTLKIELQFHLNTVKKH